MSTNEYHDMYLKCQKNKGKYFMITIDLKNSKHHCSLSKKDFLTEYKKLDNIQNYFVKLGYLNTINSITGKWRLRLGDCIGIIARTNDVNINLLYKLVNNFAKQLLEVDYHFAFGYCDTLNWAEGNKEYYAGYLFDELSNKHKKINIKGGL